MRSLALALVVFVTGLATSAEQPRTRTDLDVIVPVPPYEHERLHYFGKRDHAAVPNTVTINAPPYECDVDHLVFRQRDDFVAHLRTAHDVAGNQIAGSVVVIDGRVHFVGR